MPCMTKKNKDIVGLFNSLSKENQEAINILIQNIDSNSNSITTLASDISETNNKNKLDIQAELTRMSSEPVENKLKKYIDLRIAQLSNSSGDLNLKKELENIRETLLIPIVIATDVRVRQLNNSTRNRSNNRIPSSDPPPYNNVMRK